VLAAFLHDQPDRTFEVLACIVTEETVLLLFAFPPFSFSLLRGSRRTEVLEEEGREGEEKGGRREK
jgi:hypothetical protein